MQRHDTKPVEYGGRSETASPFDRGLTPPSQGRSASPMAANPFGAMLDRCGLAYLILDEHKEIIGWNSLAQSTLNISGERNDLRKLISSAFHELIADTRCQITPGSFCWIVIPFQGGRPVVVHENWDPSASGPCVVFLLARDTRPKANGLRLQKLFGLSGAETEVALSIACGYTVLEIAKSRNLSRTTIRSHLASLFEKTGTKRQSELLALVTRMSIVP